MSQASYEGEGPEDMKAKLHGWSQENCVSYSGTGLGARKTNSASDIADDRVTPRADTASMSDQKDYRHEIALRDEQLKREIDIRHENSKLEQAIRDKALDDRLAAFIATQAEREKALNSQLAGFYAAQSERDRTLDERFKGFHATQAERDKRIDESVADIKSEITKLGSLKLNVWGAMLSAIGILVAIAALSLTFYQTGKGDSQSSSVAGQSAANSQMTDQSAPRK